MVIITKRVMTTVLICIVYLVIFLTAKYPGGGIWSLLKVSNGESVAPIRPNNVTNERPPIHQEYSSTANNETAWNIDVEMIAGQNMEDRTNVRSNSSSDMQHKYDATVKENNDIIFSTQTPPSAQHHAQHVDPETVKADATEEQEDTTALIYNTDKTSQMPRSRDKSRTEEEAAIPSTSEEQQTTVVAFLEEVEGLEVSHLGGQEDITHMIQDTTVATEAAGENSTLGEVTIETILPRDNPGTNVSLPGNGESATGSSPGDEEADAASVAPAVSPDDHLVLDITVNLTGVALTVDGRQVYKDLKYNMSCGLHLVTLHPATGRVMAAHSYMTWQPALHKAFLEGLNDIQNGRLLVILGAPDFTSFLGEATIRVLEEMGALYIDRLAYKDAWCLLVHKGGGVLLEALTTTFLPPHSLNELVLDNNFTMLDVTPLTLHASIPRKAGGGCGWYGVAGLQERAAFCDTYDGYGDFCTCHHPPWSPLPQHPVEYEMKEVIPVAIVTARRLPHVLRQVGQVWASPGGTNTPITIFVDGHNPEAQALAALLHLPLVQHHNPAYKGSLTRISSHMKLVLSRVFEQHPKADKAIILEDDLELAPDIIPYFHQAAQLLTSDPKLFCVGAYNHNAFSHTALDPTRLYRVHGVPGCGWMVRRHVAQQMINKWPSTGEGIDWDLWTRQTIMGDRDILVPEIPRTKHRGGGGVHVTGIEQEQYYNQRPLNALLNVTLDLHGAELHNYLKLHTRNIRTGHVVHFSKHPCVELPIPRHQVNMSYVVYVDQPLEIGSTGSYYVVAKCLGLDDHYTLENLQMMYTASFYGNQLYVIGCPNSPFCITKKTENIYSATSEDMDFANEHPFRKFSPTEHLAFRVQSLSLSDEFNLNNLIHYYVQ
ncbi:protein O-linked-mannose beta-1,2-N-acetylglucosaminyltransferase 1-like [Procambarus clarkii]|uniref:protein O-linked-mannose beta-1,2-N-acetylglucosaminyltransferase 1-like n=1 Tax=Procambarus clarkii TaxID=6728 RepID=UPI003741EFF0